VQTLKPGAGIRDDKVALNGALSGEVNTANWNFAKGWRSTVRLLQMKAAEASYRTPKAAFGREVRGGLGVHSFLVRENRCQL